MADTGNGAVTLWPEMPQDVARAVFLELQTIPTLGSFRSLQTEPLNKSERGFGCFARQVRAMRLEGAWLRIEWDPAPSMDRGQGPTQAVVNARLLAWWTTRDEFQKLRTEG